MSGRDLHKKPYDEGTRDKLELYRGYLREWLPVFLNNSRISTINIFDFFAGPGTDLEENPGSPVIAYEEICGALKINKSISKPEIHLYMNDLEPEKYIGLKELAQRQSEHNKLIHFHAEQMDFSDVFPKWHAIARQTRTANMLFIDQYGVKHVSSDVFLKILQLKFTDFLFFISSSTINRFKNEDAIRGYVPVNDDDLARMTGTNVHRVVTDAYRRLIPEGTKCYLAPFSLGKGANVYGLIFGSRHPYGIEKFLRICWKKDKLRGQANFDIDAENIDLSQTPLFPEIVVPQILVEFEEELLAELSARKLTTNKDIYLFALERGFLPEHARNAMNNIIKAKQLPKQSLHISHSAWDKKDAEPIRFADEVRP